MPAIQVGDKLPSVELMENTPDNTVVLPTLLKGKKAVIFGVPGAFTPGCSMHHLPGYIKNYEKFQQKGIEDIICIAVNDPFVTSAWSVANEAKGKVRILADPTAQFTRAIGLELDLSKNLGNVRSKRYAMLVDDNVVKYIAVEADGTGLQCSIAPKILEQIH